MMGYRMVKVAAQDSGFYSTVGPFLGRRDVCKALGRPVWVEPDKVFGVVFDGDAPVAIGAVTRSGSAATLCNLFVEESHRGRGLCSRLVDELLDAVADADKVKAVVEHGVRGMFQRRGFSTTRHTTNYSYMERVQ